MISIISISFLRKTILTWYYYHLPERKYRLLSYKAEEVCALKFIPNVNLNNRLHQIEEKRRSISKIIVTLCKESSVCSDCMGKCCHGNYNHYTILDTIIRANSKKPISEFGRAPKPDSLSILLLKIIKFLLRKEDQEEQINMIVSGQQSFCSYFTADGCALSPEDRPIRCLLWTCRLFRNSLRNDIFIKLGHCCPAR